MTSHRGVLSASPSWTSPWPGSSESPWPFRSSCLLCGTPPSAGGPAGTGCAAAAPPRRSWMCSYHDDAPLLLIFITERRRSTQRLMFVLYKVCVCECVFLTIYVSVGAKNKQQSEPIRAQKQRTYKKNRVTHLTE